MEVTSNRVLNALAASKVGTWEWDIADDICRCDPVAAAIFGVSRERAMGGAPLGFFVDRLHPEDRARLGAQVAELRRRGGPYVAEYRTAPGDGRVHWVLARGRFDRNAAGVVGRACGVVIDMTDSRQDGYVAGPAFFVADAGEPFDALDRAADHAIRMREAADGLGVPVLNRLRPVMDAVLYELGRLLGARANHGAGASSGETPLH